MTCPERFNRPASGASRRRPGIVFSVLLIGGVVFLSPISVGSALAVGEAELLLSGPSGEGVEGAVFSAVPAAGSPGSGSSEALMDQRDKAFVPHVLPIQVGTGVVFENSDSIGHHVYSFSPPKRFDFYLSEGETREPVIFDSPGVVALGCNIHDWMLAYVVVLETPHFDTTDPGGRAVLGDLPPGDYRLEVWHPRIDRREEGLEREIRVEDSGAVTWRVILERSLLPDRTRERSSDYEER